MNTQKIQWYSTTPELTVKEHEPVSFTQAVQIMDEYLSRTDQKPQKGEEAIAATMFGFSRSAREFIEICVQNASQISYKFETPDQNVVWFLKPWKGLFQYNEELRSREALVQRIEEFFSYSPSEIIQRLKKKRL